MRKCELVFSKQTPNSSRLPLTKHAYRIYKPCFAICQDDQVISYYRIDSRKYWGSIQLDPENFSLCESFTIICTAKCTRFYTTCKTLILPYDTHKYGRKKTLNIMFSHHCESPKALWGWLHVSFFLWYTEHEAIKSEYNLPGTRSNKWCYGPAQISVKRSFYLRKKYRYLSNCGDIFLHFEDTTEAIFPNYLDRIQRTTPKLVKDIRGIAVEEMVESPKQPTCENRRLQNAN